MSDVTVMLENDMEEKDWLHRELKEAETNQLQLLPLTLGADCNIIKENGIIHNYESQVQLFKQERMQIMELWQTAAQELDHLQEFYQKIFTDGHNTNATGQQLIQTNCNFLKTMTGHSAEVESLQTQLRRKMKQRPRVERRQHRNKSNSFKQPSASKRPERENYESLDKVQECVQMAEEATLQKDEAQFRAKQLTEELEKTKKAFQQLIHDATLCSNEELNNVRQQCKTEMQNMAKELSLLQLECVGKQSQIERSKRERKALKEELAKVTKSKVDLGKIDALHQRCLKAEQIKNEISITLQSTQSKLKKLEVDSSEELSRWQEEVQQLKGCLAAARKDCVRISDERLQLQQENVQFRREMDELRKAFLQAQKKAKQQITQMAQEYHIKEKRLKSEIGDMEERSRNSDADLMHLLTAQQKSIQRWKVEAPKMAQALESRIKDLTEELNLHQQRAHEFEIELAKNNNIIVEYERQLVELEGKASRLQRRLTEVMQRTATPSQQLCFGISAGENHSILLKP
ncbi:sodium channel and clathrin linker 1-like isoform X6 [Festucalex cinctus]